MKILPLYVLFACVVCSFAQDEEPRPAVARGLLKRGSLAKGKASTTTTTPAPQDDAEYDEADYPAEENQEPSTEAPPSSTEGKKLVGNGVRPFRSNTDLLEALKRRRAQAAEAKLHGSSAPAASSQDGATESPTKSSYTKKRVSTPTGQVPNDDAPAPPAKPSRGRFGRPTSSRAVQESEGEEQNDAAPPSRSGRFSRRN